MAQKEVDNVEKIVAGRIILYRLECPDCGESNLSGNHKFICTTCDAKYTEKKIDNVRRIASEEKELMIKNARIKQKNKCFYCEREFKGFYSYNNKPKKIIPIIDNLKPWDLLNADNKEEIILMCNVCHLLRGKLQFEKVEEEKHLLKYLWNKNINLGKLQIY